MFCWASVGKEFYFEKSGASASAVLLGSKRGWEISSKFPWEGMMGNLENTTNLQTFHVNDGNEMKMVDIVLS